MEGNKLLELISIIIPVYNSEKYLRNCMDSVIGQTHSNLEIILVDDASTDSSGSICDEYANTDNRIKVIHHEHNKGLSLSKYDGYKIATGEWISFIDNDDLITQSMYHNMSELAAAHKEADMICIAGEDVDSHSIGRRLLQLNGGYDLSSNRNLKHDVKCVNGISSCQLLYGNNMQDKDNDSIQGIYTATWGKIVRRSLFEKALNETIKHKEELYWIFLEDVLFIPICMHMARKVIISEQISYLHRMSEANLSAKLKPSEYHYETIIANDVVQKYYRDNGLSDVADCMLKGLLLNMQSVWYKVYRYEEDSCRRTEGLSTIKCLWTKYYGLYRKHRSGNRDLVSTVSIVIFNFSNKIWLHTIGDLHFKYGI